MAAQFDVSSGLGSFIDAWAPNLVEPFRPITPILSDMPFVSGEEMGGVFHKAVRVTIESGTTFAAPRTTPGDGGLPYVGARNSYTPDWQVEAPQIHGRSRVTYEAIARSASSVSAEGGEGDKRKAVKAATAIIFEGIMSGTIKKAEALMLHGRRGIGQVEVNSSVVAASTVAGNELANPFDANAAGFIIDISISPATWAEAIFLQSEGGTFDLYTNSSGVPVAPKLNATTNTVLSAGANQTGLVLTSINPPTPQAGTTATGRLLRFFHSSGTLGGAGTGIIGGAAFNSISAGAFLFYESGGPSTTEYVSLTAMAQNTSTIFNVSGVQYSVAKGNTVASVGNLKLADLVRYHARPINKGGMGKRFRAIVPTELFAQFANDESTLKRYVKDSGEAKSGFDSLELYLPHKSSLEIVGHNLQKDGEVLSYIPKETQRIGSQDFDFVKRGGNRNQLILEVAQQPTSECRIYGQFAPLADAPCHLLSLTGVTF
jgi:hypothetical protein